MFKWFVLALVLLGRPVAHADILVLKSGKQFAIDGSYEIRGKFLVFRSENGELNQLPVSMVDLEKSKEATEAFLAAQLEIQNRGPEKPRNKEMTMAEIAAVIEAERSPTQPAPTAITLKNEGLEKFSENHPRQVNDSVDVEYSEGGEFSIEAVNEKRKSFQESYEKLQEKKDQLDAKIQDAENFAIALEQESAFGDDPAGSTYEAMDTAYKQVEQLKAERAEVEKELKTLGANARQASVKNYKRPPKTAPKPPDAPNSDEEEEYR